MGAIKNNRMPSETCNLYFDKPVTRWDEAIPLGNGLTGCLIWGNGAPLRFSLDRGDLWDTRVTQESIAEDYKYEELIRLVKNKDQEAILKRFDEFYNQPVPTKIPAGAMELSFEEGCSNITSTLSLSDAMAEVNLKYKNETVTVRAFTHATELFGFISVTGTIPKLSLKAPDFASNDEDNPKGLKLLGYPAAVYESKGNLTWFHQKTCNQLEYALITAQKRISDNQVNFVYIIAYNNDGDNWFEDACKKVMRASELDFEEASLSHIKWWHSFWSKSAVRVSDKEYEKMWYITNYLFGSCSRKGFPPMPLQGVWTADDGGLPPWKGDYHHDLNTQLSYWHYLKANHLEEGEAFLDFLWDLVPEARNFAREFFDAPGICLPSVMSINGKSLGGWPMYATNLVNQIWLCQAFEHYWKYTGSIEFLKEKAYPYFKETAKCIMRWLEPGEDGKLYLPLSSSPEIHDNTIEAWLTPNSNNDLSLIMYLFKTLSNMAKTIGNGEESIWDEKYNQLPKLAVNENNVLMLNPEESLKESHRHHSHAMPIYPLKLLKYNNEKDKAVIDATIKNLEVLGTGLWVGFSFAWMANFYAVQGNGEGAAYQLKLFWECLCSQNGFHLNGDYKKRGISSFHYRPFTLESNMAAADALQEMLLFTDNGEIKVFPAIPDSWRKNGAAFEDFRGENGVLVSSEIKDNSIQYITLKAENAGTYNIVNVFGSERLAVKRSAGEELITCVAGELFKVHLEKGECCNIALA